MINCAGKKMPIANKQRTQETQVEVKRSTRLTVTNVRELVRVKYGTGTHLPKNQQLQTIQSTYCTSQQLLD